MRRLRPGALVCCPYRSWRLKTWQRRLGSHFVARMIDSKPIERQLDSQIPKQHGQLFDVPFGNRTDSTALLSIVTGTTIIAALYFAREVLIPLALAILISFVLAPLAHALRRLGLPRIASVIAVVAFSFAAILGVGALGTSQISQLTGDLPNMKRTYGTKSAPCEDLPPIPGPYPKPPRL